MKNAKKISITILVVLFSILLIPSIISVSGQETIIMPGEQKWIQLPEEWGIEPKGGGTLIARVYREPTHFNPNYEYLVGDECYQNIFSRLVRYDTISYDKLSDIITLNEQTPGKYALFDYLGNEIIKRSNIKLVFLNGNHPEYIEEVINGKHRGTIVQ